MRLIAPPRGQTCFDRFVNISIRRLSPQEFSLLAPQLVEIYIEAMDYNDSIRVSRTHAWRREISHPGFSAVVATTEGGIVGLAYGFLGSPDTWWDRQLRRGFYEKGGPTEQQWALLRSYFELAEVHVRPGMQNHGIGRRLITELLWNVAADYVALSTPEVPQEGNSAFGLYRSLGFRDALRHHRYPGDSRPFALLYAPLPLPAVAQPRTNTRDR